VFSFKAETAERLRELRDHFLRVVQHGGEDGFKYFW
jgi:hypothetical protein